MGEVDYTFLELLGDEELLVACKNTDLSLLITPMKDRPKFYEKYTKRFERLDKKSQLVQKLLPKIAFDLYKKGDKTYKEVLTFALKRFHDHFIEAISSCMKPTLTIEEIKKYQLDEIVNLYFKLEEAEVFVGKISIEMFFMLLKLQGVVYEINDSSYITERIEQNKKINMLKKEFDKEKQDEVKKAVKQATVQFEQQKEQFVKEKKEVVQALSIAKNRITELEDTIQELQKKILQDRDKSIEKYCIEYEKEINERKIKIEQQYQINIEILQNEHLEIKKILVEALNVFREENEKQREKIAEDTNNLILKKTVLLDEINSLIEKQKQEQEKIVQVEDYVNSYFDKFEQRIIERKIEYALGKKIGLFATGNHNVGNEQLSNEDMNRADSECRILVDAPKPISHDMEYSKDAQDLEDFVSDFKDNLSLYFDDSLDIASVILTAVLNKKRIILSEIIGKEVANCLAALVDLSSPLVLDVGNENYSANAILDVIGKSNSQVIYILGLLDKFDESIFSAICRKCGDRFIFFGISNMENIDLMSKNITNYAIILDIEKYLHFPEDDYIVVGNYDLHSFGIKYDEKLCREYYKSYFKNLSMRKIIGQKKALDFSVLMQTYFKLMSGVQMGEVLQKVILFACDLSHANSEELSDILAKSGITVQLD